MRLRGWESNPRGARLTAGCLTIRRPRISPTHPLRDGGRFFWRARALGFAVGTSRDQVFRERTGAVRRADAPWTPSVFEGCQSWVRTRASRVRAGDPSAGPTGNRDKSGCRAWVRTRASRVKAGHPSARRPGNPFIMGAPGSCRRRRTSAVALGASVSPEGLEPSRWRVRAALSASRDPSSHRAVTLPSRVSAGLRRHRLSRPFYVRDQHLIC